MKTRNITSPYTGTYFDLQPTNGNEHLNMHETEAVQYMYEY